MLQNFIEPARVSFYYRKFLSDWYQKFSTDLSCTLSGKFVEELSEEFVVKSWTDRLQKFTDRLLIYRCFENELITEMYNHHIYSEVKQIFGQ